MFQNSEKNIAKCYVYEEGDESRKFELTDQRLVVHFKNKIYEWPLEITQKISVNQRKLLIPIIFSGIFTPLIIVGFFKSFFNPVIAILFLIMGILGFYTGWMGQTVITIVLVSGHHDIPVRSVSINLSEFISFFNAFIKKETPHRHAIYAFIDIMEFDKTRIAEIVNNNIENTRFYTYSQIKREISKMDQFERNIIVIDPLSSDIKIDFKRSEEGSLSPKINSRVDPESISGVYPIQTLIEMI